MKFKIYILAILFFALFGGAGSAWAATINATSCSYADVSAAISGASAGDTVNVPAGECTWSSALHVTIPITLRGAGSGQTVITGQVSDTYHGVIAYQYTSSTATPSRLTGFTIDNTGYNSSAVTLAVAIGNAASGWIIDNFRVDHNMLKAGSSAIPAIDVYGIVFGVIDNNEMTGYANNEAGGNEATYDLLIDSIAFGNDDNLYYEDNTIISGYNLGFGGGHGARYVARYNDINMTKTSSGTNVFDVHGNMNGPVPTMMIGEMYGNDTSHAAASNRLVDMHGGMNLVFYNYVSNNNNGIQIRELFNDGLYRYGTISGSGSNFTSAGNVPTDAAGTCNVRIASGTGVGQDFAIATRISSDSGTISGTWSPNPSGLGFIYYTSGTKSERVQKVHNAYIWNNRLLNGNLIPTTLGGDDFYTGYIANDPPSLAENREFWNQGALFDGTAGVGCGTLGSRPVTCTTGVGYWATDQSCSDLTGMVGANPSTPISGTLYKCTAPNTWTAYYTPYIYPHPLRNESAPDTTPPSAPQGLAVQ